MGGARPGLTIAAAQPACVPHDVEANARAHAATVAAAAAQVVVFPELSLIGYELGAAPVDPSDPRLEPLVDACAKSGSLALAGAPVEGAGGSRHIGILAVDERGADVAYRKMHLGDAESASFAPGPGPERLERGGWLLGLAVCKDTGAVEHASATAALGMDAYLASVLEAADDAAVVEERARRIATEQGVWVVIASFAGAAGGGYASAAGGSGIWSPDGAPVARAGRAPGEVVRATLT